jgi:predicted unusual protein kinase regulating ubiquinone biosynthesis (AarF/ABC1/UbiB family)
MPKAKHPDSPTLTGRVRRYARVGGAVGGFAVRYAGDRLLNREVDHSRQAADIKNALGGLKGPLMKIAQILATVPDTLPQEYLSQFAELQTNAPPMGWAFVRRRMAAELGPDWQGRFVSFEHEAARAASLGQVHRAVIAGERGRKPLAVACKLQYPDMASAVEADLRQLKVVLSLYHRYDGSVDASEIHTELSDRLREELDYRREAANMGLYRAILKGEKGVHVPETIARLSTGRLLTMTWLDGVPLLATKEAPQADRNRIAYNMFRAWYAPFYGFGIIHGDPHLGNYSVRPDRTINLMDFGCIRIFPARFVSGVLDLYKALQTDDRALAAHAYETWGFENLSGEVMDVLNQWAAFVYAPLMEDREQSIQDNNGGAVYGTEVAGKVHKELRRVGGVRPPREFVLMDRAAIGLGSVFLHLRAKINWYRLFHELIADYDEGRLQRRQAKALAEFGIPAPA